MGNGIDIDNAICNCMRNDGEWKWDDQPNEFPSVCCLACAVNNFQAVPNSLSVRETETETSDEEMEEIAEEQINKWTP
jgi:hypothetical protein